MPTNWDGQRWEQLGVGSEVIDLPCLNVEIGVDGCSETSPVVFRVNLAAELMKVNGSQVSQ
jgi:hypothetical protein